MRNLGVIILLVLCVLPARGVSQTPGCPQPTVAQGGQCVLLSDARLDSTLHLSSFIDLNCRGHRLSPGTAGVLDDPRTVANEFQPSRPELAILLHRAYGTRISNCVIEGFDFGILLVDTKTPDGGRGTGQMANKILANTIDVRTTAIDLMKSDNAHLAGNRLTYASERGRGVVIEYDSDFNEITGNTITSTDAASTGMVRQLPGDAFVTGTATMDNKIHTLQADRPLHNVIVDGELIQVAAGDRLALDFEDAARPDHNVIEDNTIVDAGVGASCTLDPATACRANSDCGPTKGACLLKQDSGIGFNVRSGDAIVRGNSIGGHMERGISFGGVATVFTQPSWYPGTCSLDASRLCTESADCNIAGYDVVSKGACTGTSPLTFNGNSVRLTAEQNVLTGVFDSAALFANNTDGFAFDRNIVDAAAGTPAGVSISGAALNGNVLHNVVNGAANALFLGQPPRLTWTVALNDFTGYSTAVRTTNDYTTVTELGGNYWGLPCPGLDPDTVRFENGGVNPNVTDPHAYGVPVATSEDPVPACAAPSFIYAGAGFATSGRTVSTTFFPDGMMPSVTSAPPSITTLSSTSTLNSPYRPFTRSTSVFSSRRRRAATRTAWMPDTQ